MSLVISNAWLLKYLHGPVPFSPYGRLSKHNSRRILKESQDLPALLDSLAKIRAFKDTIQNVIERGLLNALAMP